MAARTRVRVTQDDYLKAVRNHSARCAIARAVRRTFPEATMVQVDIQTIRFTLGDERFSWLTPPKAQDTIVYFDAGEWSRLEPFGFDLRPNAAVKIARKRFATDADRERSNRAKRAGHTQAGVKRTTTEGRKAPRRSMGGGVDRAYGSRVLSINQYRERDGLLGPVEDVPNE